MPTESDKTPRTESQDTVTLFDGLFTKSLSSVSFSDENPEYVTPSLSNTVREDSLYFEEILGDAESGIDSLSNLFHNQTSRIVYGLAGSGLGKLLDVAVGISGNQQRNLLLKERLFTVRQRDVSDESSPFVKRLRCKETFPLLERTHSRGDEQNLQPESQERSAPHPSLLCDTSPTSTGYGLFERWCDDQLSSEPLTVWCESPVSGTDTRGCEQHGLAPPVWQYVNPKEGCKCRRSNCIKRYCSCYTKARHCHEDWCQCQGCENNPMSSIWRKAVTAYIGHGNKSPNGVTGIIRFCECVENKCLKKYCICFRAGRLCTSSCKCSACMNVALAHDRKSAGKLLQGSPM